MAGDDIPVNGELLGLVYYARSHRGSEERFSMDELMATVEELRAKGLVDRTIDIGRIMAADEPANQSPRKVRSSGAIPRLCKGSSLPMRWRPSSRRWPETTSP